MKSYQRNVTVKGKLMVHAKRVLVTVSILNFLFAFVLYNGFGIERFSFLNRAFFSMMSEHGKAEGPMALLKLLLVESVLFICLFKLYRYRILYNGIYRVLMFINFAVTGLIILALFLAYLFSVSDEQFQL